MRVLVIPDIHLKPWIFDRTEKILRDGKADRTIRILSGVTVIMMSAIRGEDLRPDILPMPRGR